MDSAEINSAFRAASRSGPLSGDHRLQRRPDRLDGHHRLRRIVHVRRRDDDGPAADGRLDQLVEALLGCTTTSGAYSHRLVDLAWSSGRARPWSGDGRCAAPRGPAAALRDARVLVRVNLNVPIGETPGGGSWPTISGSELVIANTRPG